MLYDLDLYDALLTSLCFLLQPHTLAFVAFKQRHKSEAGFVTMAAGRGLFVEEVALAQLHEEYSTGDYGIYRLCCFEGMQVE